MSETKIEYRLYGRKNGDKPWIFWASRDNAEDLLAYQQQEKAEPHWSDMEWEMRELTVRTRKIALPEGWIKDRHYFSAGESPKWKCVYVFKNGVGVLVHQQHGTDVILRVSLADREFYQEAT